MWGLFTTNYHDLPWSTSTIVLFPRDLLNHKDNSSDTLKKKSFEQLFTAE